MKTRAVLILLLAVSWTGSIAAQQAPAAAKQKSTAAKKTDQNKPAVETKEEDTARKKDAADDAGKAPSPSAAPANDAINSLREAVTGEFTLLLLLFTLMAAGWGVAMWKIGRKAQPAVDTAALETSIAALPTRALIEDAVRPLSKTADAGTLASAADLGKLRDDLARLSQDVAMIKSSNDAILNLASRLVPGLPPNITSVEPASESAGAAVVIFGSNFQPGTRVWFGTADVQPDKIEENAVWVTVPKGVTGAVNLAVQGQNGLSAPRRFTVAS
jgi:hypothetical protein